MTTPSGSIESHAERLGLRAIRMRRGPLGQEWTIQERNGYPLLNAYTGVVANWLAGWEAHAASLVAEEPERTLVLGQEG